MKKTYFLIFFSFLFISASAQQKNKNTLPIVKITNSNLLNIIDNFIAHEKQCDYYSPDLIFVFGYLNNEDTIVFELSSIGKKHYYLLEQERFCFERQGHLFSVWGFDNLPDDLFLITDAVKQIKLSKLSKGDILIDDDGFTRWYYRYINGTFIEGLKFSYCNDIKYKE